MARNRKTLLTESEIRRFMKLADMGAVGTKRMESLYPGARDEEEELGVELGAEEEELAMEPALEPEPEGELEVPEEPLDGLEGDVGGADTISIADFVSALEQAVEEVTGQPTTADLDAGEEGEEAPLEGGDELSAEMPEEPVGLPPEEEEDPFAMQEQIVNRIAKRVAARLVKENKKTQLAEQLTERIFNRLTQK
jgi:hypothetical protein